MLEFALIEFDENYIYLKQHEKKSLIENNRVKWTYGNMSKEEVLRCTITK